MVVDVSQDWVLACDVQQGFMQVPCTARDFLDYSARCRQVRTPGGDGYNFIPLNSDRLALVVGDAEGHQTDDARLAVVRVGLLCTNRGAFALPHQAERLAIPA
jgi:hypothetical protein